MWGDFMWIRKRLPLWEDDLAKAVCSGWAACRAPCLGVYTSSEQRKGPLPVRDAGLRWGHVCWEYRRAFSPARLSDGALGATQTSPSLATLPVRTEANSDRHSGPARPVHTQDTGPRPPPPPRPQPLDAGCHRPLPRSPLSSSGTTSGERCAWSHRIPGPRQPGGLFFPR